MGLSWNDIGRLFLAFFLPPLAVLATKEKVDNDFWINLILTLLGWLPGFIHALYIVLDGHRGGYIRLPHV